VVVTTSANISVTSADIGVTGTNIGISSTNIDRSSNNIVVIFGNVAVVITSADIGWCQCRLVSVVEARALELKLIVFIISSSSLVFLDLTS
jgi:hypothetical protein